MPLLFVDSGNGSPTAPYETWAKAATTLLVAVAAASAGDDIIIGHDHSESPNTTLTYAFSTTAATINRVISATSTAGGSVVTYNKADNIQIDNSAGANFIKLSGHVKLYGVSLKVGDNLVVNSARSHVLFDDSLLELSSAGGLVNVQAEETIVHLKNTDLNWSTGSAANAIKGLNGATVIWDGGILSLTGTQPNALFDGQDGTVRYQLSGVDLSALTSAIIDVTDTTDSTLSLHHCLLNSGVALFTGTISSHGQKLLMSGCDDTADNDLYRLEYIDFWGSTVHDDAIFRTTGGASDGGTPISWKMVSTANAVEFSEPTKSPPIYSWVDATGSTTFTVQCLWDSVTDIQDDEAWLEIEFLEASADTDSAFADDRMADISATPADQTTNATAWTETLTNDNEFELAVTATVNRVGPVIARVCLAKPSTTIYADPLIVKS